MIPPYVFYGNGDGAAWGNGYGYGNGWGTGYGYSSGDGFGDGDGSGDGGGWGAGVDGCGLIDGDGFGDGDGNEDGYGWGNVPNLTKGKTMNQDIITIDGVKYQKIVESGDIRIVILHRGFVYVGHFEQDGVNCILREAYNVRRWGTNEGLGELARKGPLQDSILDPSGTVRFHERGVIASIDCSVEWEKWYGSV